jgi:hypothetical protein
MKIMAQQFHTFTAKRASENYGGSPHRLHMNPWRASVFRVAADPCNAQNAPRSTMAVHTALFLSSGFVRLLSVCFGKWGFVLHYNY